jgi:hypothetical protein
MRSNYKKSSLKCDRKKKECSKEKWIWIPKIKTRKINAKEIKTSRLHVRKTPVVTDQGVQFGSPNLGGRRQVTIPNPSFNVTTLLHRFAATPPIPFLLTATQGGLLFGFPGSTTTTSSGRIIGFNSFFDIFLTAPLGGGIFVTLLGGISQFTAVPTPPLSSDVIATFIPEQDITLTNIFFSLNNLIITATLTGSSSTSGMAAGTIIVNYNNNTSVGLDLQSAFNWGYQLT